MGTRGGMIVELIDPVAGEIDLYTRVLPDDQDFSVRLHHIATHTAPGEDEWNGSRRSWAIPISSSTTRC